ncbi:hypothetical protein A6R70_14645 [Agrobacterium rubi]|uniref:hypothetical protein n=1 Tax=Agrobacterium rubi TaxID=28099 RepID=UPI00201B4876|nr:hypothetical protein [Agrobacterium rubi]MCL6653528.1 hypothetical protein [Agrobacterium rubi]
MAEINIDDGGSAFPLIPPVDETGRAAVGYPYPEPGMTLRDHFASQALAGFAGNPAIFAANNQNGWELVNASARDLADRAYWLADAMIAVRKAGA